MQWSRENYTISCDPSKQDIDVVASFLKTSYWAKDIPTDTVAKSLQHSLCFALLDGDRQIGLARVVSDFATFAFLSDVFVLPDYRGKGLGKWLIECVLAHPELQGLRRWMLGTKDAHGLYRKYGFTPVTHPETLMELRNPNVYRGDSR